MLIFHSLVLKARSNFVFDSFSCHLILQVVPVLVLSMYFNLATLSSLGFILSMLLMFVSRIESLLVLGPLTVQF